MIKCNYKNCERQLHNLNFISTQDLANDLNFKTCHYCTAYYCSRECRKYDWQNHKLNYCYYGNLSSLCKRIVSKIGRCYRLRLQLSKISKTAYLSTLKRGFVWLDFKTNAEAQTFIDEPIVLDDTHVKTQQFENTESPSETNLSDFLFYFGNNLLPKYVCFENYSNFSTVNNVSNKQQATFIERNDVILKNLFNLNDKLNESNTELNDYKQFKELCLTYNPMEEFILLISVQTKNQNTENLNPRKGNINKYVVKYMKFRFINQNSGNITQRSITKSLITIDKPTNDLNSSSAIINNEMLNIPPIIDSTIANINTNEDVDASTASATLILTSLNKMNIKEDVDETDDAEAMSGVDTGDEESRQLFMANLLTEFESRGINIKTKYPKLYRDLCLYVEQNKPFTPLCLFPRDLSKNNLFMCLILPNSEPANYSWLYECNNNLEKSLNLSNYLYIV